MAAMVSSSAPDPPAEVLLPLLRAAAMRVLRDLRATHAGGFEVVIGDDLLMTLSREGRSESVQLGSDWLRRDWPDDEPDTDGLTWSPADAEAYLASEVGEVMELWGERWPVCPTHGHVLGGCGGEWFCDGPPEHSIAVGSLGDAVDARTAAGADPLEPGPGVRVSPVREREWVDDDGTRWHLRGRGQPIDIKRVARLLRDAEVRVLHVDGPGTRVDVGPGDRTRLWARIEPYLRGTVDREPNDQTDVVVGEFKDDQGRSMLVIDEVC